MQFLLVTTMYVMEPWERLLMISIFLVVASFVTYSLLIFVPIHFHNIMQAVMPNITEVLLN
jgi:hypothetical protein